MKTKLTVIIVLLSLLILPSCSSEPNLTLSEDGIGRTEVKTFLPPTTSPEPTVTDEPPIDLGITVCIDPGHGFDDGGAVSELLGDRTEKDITLDISMKLADKLTALGYRVVFTHDGKSFPKSSMDNGNNIFDPKERIAYANTLDTDIFISIHCNSFSQSYVKGIRLYYCDGGNELSDAASAFAADLSLSISDNMLPDVSPEIYPKSTAEAYYVTRFSKVPSVLVETGFITNAEDAANMLDEEWRDEIASALADGIVSYFSTGE